MYFNPRAHAGRDGFARLSARDDNISIHAPTRGATHGRYARERRAAISIHAPTRGATPTTVPQIPPHSHFNPRAHAGRDPMRRFLRLRRHDFNPRARVGRD